jgi:hypothetical protein
MHNKYCTHSKQADKPRPGRDLWIYIEIDGKRKTGSVNKYFWGLFTRLRKGKFGHGLKADVPF